MKTHSFRSYLTAAAAFHLATLLTAWAGSGATVPDSPDPIAFSSAIATGTTLGAETGNNTSTASSFPGQTNGNAAAGNVSKVPLRQLLYSGSTTKIYSTWLGWFGQPSHMLVGYTSNNAAQVHVQDMISRGMRGVIAVWYGTSNTSIEAATTLLRNEVKAHAGKFEFAIMEDTGALASAAMNNGCDVTEQLISDLTYIASQYESSPAYTRVNGRPVVYLFSVDAYYIDWNRVRSSIPGNPLLVLRGINGLTRPSVDGGFSWVNIQSNNPFDPELNLQDSFFQAAQLAPKRVAVGSAFKGFNDTLAAWSTNRVIDQNCGQTWLQSFREVGKFYSSNKQLPSLQIATWNDYEEGTALETGIDNCVYLVPSQSGSTVKWAVQGNENTIDHYRVFISTDGKNLSVLADLPRGTHAFDLSSVALVPKTTYFVFIKAIGLPSIQNKMSPAICLPSRTSASHYFAAGIAPRNAHLHGINIRIVR